MTLELLNNPISTCSQKVRLCLYEKDLEFTNTRIDFRKKEHLAPDYLKLNPNGVVPTLLHDGRPITDSSVIIEYLDEVFPDTSLSPADPYEHARMRAWLRYIEEVPTSAIRVPSFNKAFVRHYAELGEDDLRSNAAARPIRKHFYERMGNAGFSREETDASLQQLSATVGRMDAALADKDWLLGGELTLADYCVVPTIDRMADLGLSYIWDGAESFERWWSAIRERDAYRKTYHTGSRVSDIYEDLKEAS